MRKLGWTSLIIGFFLALALVSYLAALRQGGPLAEAAPGTDVGIDVDPTGNTATSLGTIESCISVTPGQQFSIDVFVTEIPLGDDLAGFNYEINFDDSRVGIIAQNHNQLLASTSGSSVIDLSEAVPDTVSHHAVLAADFCAAEAGPNCGVHGR